MPIHYAIDHEQRLVTVQALGQVAMREFIDYQRDVWSRADVVGYHELVDISQGEALDVTSDRLQQLATLAASMDGVQTDAKLAIVASATHAYGLGRMYDIYRGMQKGSHKRVGVFRSRDEALAWLKEP